MASVSEERARALDEAFWLASNGRRKEALIMLERALGEKWAQLLVPHSEIVTPKT
jgi:hypothetical protein